VARKPRSKTATRRSSRGGGSSRSPTVYTGTSKRVIDFLAKNPYATVAQARGHKPDEHRTREQRARKEKRLTERQRAAIRRNSYITAKQMDGDPDEEYRRLVAWAQREGYRAFEAMEKERRYLAKHRSGVKVRVRKGVATLHGDLDQQGKNFARMDRFVTRYNVPEPKWLYYGAY
jgi:hypothetical protein